MTTSSFKEAMTATTPTTAAGGGRPSAPVLRAGLLAVLLAAVATTTLAAVGHAAGVSLDLAGEPIPALAFGVLTVVFGLVGVLLAVALSRRSRQPRRAFVTTTAVLVVLSLVPDLLADAAVSTRALLMTTHLVAAAIIVPALARRLPTGPDPRP